MREDPEAGMMNTKRKQNKKSRDEREETQGGRDCLVEI